MILNDREQQSTSAGARACGNSPKTDAEEKHQSTPSPTLDPGCWGVKGGKAGRPFEVTIDPGGPDERQVELGNCALSTR